MSFVWIGLATGISLLVAGGAAYLLLQALFRVIAANAVRTRE